MTEREDIGQEPRKGNQQVLGRTRGQPLVPHREQGGGSGQAEAGSGLQCPANGGGQCPSGDSPSPQNFPCGWGLGRRIRHFLTSKSRDLMVPVKLGSFGAKFPQEGPRSDSGGSGVSSGDSES